jgi:glycerol-3-phosphate dehydrogenase
MRVQILQLMQDESVFHLDDLLLRRTNWAEHPEQLDQLANMVCAACEWDENRRIAEKARLALALRQAGNSYTRASARRTTPAMNSRSGVIAPN